jgi:Oxidoreductase family, NAD-binding Rossmann fold/TAT (twin-arginine translocation) pathway signal sequence
MKKTFDRRNFLKSSAVAGLGLGLTFAAPSVFAKSNPVVQKGKRIGIIGLDTSHSVAFTKTFNDENAGPEYGGYKVVAAYPKGSNDIESSVTRIPGYIEEVKKYGVTIVDSIKDLLREVDVVLLETNDGRLHLEQAIPVFKAGKTVFIDKPIAAFLPDVLSIFNAAKKYNVPVFSASSLRYGPTVQAMVQGKAGNILGADVYSPAHLEKTHMDFSWYGIHGVEMLYTLMGTGCKSVSRTHTTDADVIVGLWDNDRIGTVRGIRYKKSGYGGSVYGDKSIELLDGGGGYNPLLVEVVKFFQSGQSPVKPEETIEIFAFMEAADESKRQGGNVVTLESVMQKAKASAK